MNTDFRKQLSQKKKPLEYTKEMVQRRNEEWPPGCISILHQPKRPGVKDKQ